MSGDFSQAFTEMASANGVDMSETSSVSFCVGMSSIAGEGDFASVMGAGDFGVIMLKRFMGRFESFRLGE